MNRKPEIDRNVSQGPSSNCSKTEQETNAIRNTNSNVVVTLVYTGTNMNKTKREHKFLQKYRDKYKYNVS